MNRIPAANRDLARLIEVHLFVICPNDSGSSFLAGALEASRAVWCLPREGQKMHGYAGPLPWRPHGPDQWLPGLLWAAEQRWIDLFSDPREHDWPRTRKAWYFQAFATDAPRLGVRHQVAVAPAVRGTARPALPQRPVRVHVCATPTPSAKASAVTTARASQGATAASSRSRARA